MDHTYIVNLFALMVILVFLVPVGILFFFNWKHSHENRKNNLKELNVQSLKEAGIEI